MQIIFIVDEEWPDLVLLYKFYFCFNVIKTSKGLYAISAYRADPLLALEVFFLCLKNRLCIAIPLHQCLRMYIADIRNAGKGYLVQEIICHQYSGYFHQI